jgi:hypothetical protein
MNRPLRIWLRRALAALRSSGPAVLVSYGLAAAWSSCLALVLSASLLSPGCADMGEPDDGTGIPVIDGVGGYIVRSYAYSAYDTTGRLLVTGKLQIGIQDTGLVSRKIRGNWELARRPGIDPGETGPQDGKGSLVGTLSGDEMDGISMNLNPSFVDNNVILHGSIGQSKITGTWSWIGYPGIIAEGPFTATSVE